MKTSLQRYGPWALVTGASSGIGAEYARQLAAEGFNLVIVARREGKLVLLSQALEKEFAVQTRVVVADLSHADCLDVIQTATDDLEIGLLVNNAGAALPGVFLKQSLEGRSAFVTLNVMTPMQLTHHFATKMVARKRGGIVLVSSIAGFNASPYIASYAAAKSYLLNFGLALGTELAPHNVDVLVLAPGATRTEMINTGGLNMRNAKVPWMSAQRVVAQGMAALGKKQLVIPGRTNHFFTNVLQRLMPKRFAMWVMARTMEPYLDPDLK